MVANKNNFRFILINLFLVISFSVFAESKVSDTEIFDFLHKNVAKSTAELGAAIESCEKKKLNSKVTILSVDELKKLKVNNNQVIIALTHLNFNNSFQCERNARVGLAYDLGVLSLVKDTHRSDSKDINEIEENLIYPSIRQIGLSIKYLKQPSKLREYIEREVGDKPFDLIKTLKANNLLHI